MWYAVLCCDACRSSDHLPWIGLLYRGTDSIYTATGMSKWGLANGVVAGQLIHDYIMQRQAENKYAKMLDARRLTLKTMPGMIQENVHVTQHFISDKLKSLVAPSIDTLKPGTGGLVKVKGTTVGAYLDKVQAQPYTETPHLPPVLLNSCYPPLIYSRSPRCAFCLSQDGKYHFVKPICTHLGGTVLFNQGDCVWDCPLHGSQFGVDGDVIHGPACKGLEVIKDLEW